MQGQGQAHVDEAELVRKAQEGNAAALTALYERFFERIFRYASFKVGSPPEAEDITADVFVRMLEAIGSFRWRGHPFSSWLFRIAHNLVVDHFRKRERRKAVPLDSVAATASSSFDDPDDKRRPRRQAGSRNGDAGYPEDHGRPHRPAAGGDIPSLRCGPVGLRDRPRHGQEGKHGEGPSTRRAKEP